MKFTVHLVVCDNDGHEETVTNVVSLDKACQHIEQVGWTLTQTKVLLTALQQRIAERQAAAFLATCLHCQACDTPLRTKGHYTITFRTIFGTLRLRSLGSATARVTHASRRLSAP
jgi:hypothetical protein